MGILYAEDGKIFCRDYLEIYVPQLYFDTGVAHNLGSTIETFGVCYTREFKNGEGGDIRMLSCPALVNLILYNSRNTSIKVHGRSIDVVALEYIKGSYVMHQTIVKGREVANDFLEMMLDGKLPATINYASIIDLWWRNLQISDVSFKVPSKIYEIIIASIYRNPNNPKTRFGQHYGRQSNPDGLDYKAQPVRAVVKDLSTFSGMIYEDISTMISSGINNSLNNVEEPVSPLEKIIHY